MWNDGRARPRGPPASVSRSKADARRAVCRRIVCDERPDIRMLEIALDSVPLRGDLVRPVRVASAPTAAREQKGLEQLGVRERNPTDVEAREERRRVQPLGASYQMTRTLLHR